MFGRPTVRSRTILQIIATLVAFPFLLPLVAMVSKSFQGAGFVENYTAVLTQTPFLRSLWNSSIISAGVFVIVYVCTMAAGYAFGKLQFAGKKLAFNAILVGLVLPTIALIVPLFIFVQKLNLFNSYLAVIVPLATTIIPFTLLLTRNYLASTPDEVIEASRIDGCNSFGTLIRIVIPLARPITAVLIVWAFLQAWNEFFCLYYFCKTPQNRLLLRFRYILPAPMGRISQRFLPLWYSSAYRSSSSISASKSFSKRAFPRAPSSRCRPEMGNGSRDGARRGSN